MGFGVVILLVCQQVQKSNLFVGESGCCLGKLYMRRVLERLVQNWRKQTIFGFGFDKKRCLKRDYGKKNNVLKDEIIRGLTKLR